MNWKESMLRKNRGADYQEKAQRNFHCSMLSNMLALLFLHSNWGRSLAGDFAEPASLDGRIRYVLRKKSLFEDIRSFLFEIQCGDFCSWVLLVQVSRMPGDGFSSRAVELGIGGVDGGNSGTSGRLVSF